MKNTIIIAWLYIRGLFKGYRHWSYVKGNMCLTASGASQAGCLSVKMPDGRCLRVWIAYNGMARAFIVENEAWTEMVPVLPCEREEINKWMMEPNNEKTVA